jgi:hypothetical protein
MTKFEQLLSQGGRCRLPNADPEISLSHPIVVATSGVDKGQGRNHREVVTHAY